MGLDITAITKAEFIHSKWQDDEGDDTWSIYKTNGDIDRLDGKPEGVYRGVDALGFRAGSYGGYNEWRTKLCEIFLKRQPEDVWENPDAFAEAPFVELINFSDCEGAIGPETSKKLARDFEIHKETARQQMDEWEFSRYELWQQAFEAASDDGFVIFH